MNQPVLDTQPATTRPAVRLPPGPRIPKPLQGILFTFWRKQMFRHLSLRYGNAFTINIPVWGQSVVVTDPDLARQAFLTRPDDLGNSQPNLGRVLGSGSVFALPSAEHRRRRSVLSPPFHGKNVRVYEQIVVEETLRETAGWPAGKEFATLPAMTRIALNVILRATFGAQGTELDELRRVIPRFAALASRWGFLPMPSRTYGRFTPWGRLAHWRSRYEAILDTLITRASADPDFEDRRDVLTMMLCSRYEDGTAMSRKEIGDELLALIVAGHESSFATLAWAFERLSRHPELLAALAAEADTDENTLRGAAIREVQRTRTVISHTARHVQAPEIKLGEWVIPRGFSVIVAISQIHNNPDAFPDPARFDPHRYLAGTRPTAAWIPYGGGPDAAWDQPLLISRWMSCCERCCGSSRSTRIPIETKDRITAG
jgi:cytochrome P450